MVFLWTFLTLFATIVLLIYAKYKRKINYWKQNNVELISIWEFGKKAKRKPWGLVVNEYYEQMCLEQKPFKVIESLLVSAVIVQDLEAIKAITTTQFESFPDRGFYVNHRDALSTSLARLDYDLWKPMRQKLTPSLSPAKLKNMFPILQEVAKQLELVMREQCLQGLHQMEIYDLCARYTTDIVGNIAFGVECNSLKEPDTKFRLEGDRAFLQLPNPFVEQFVAKFPKLMHLLNVKIFCNDSNAFFTDIVKKTIEYREKYNVRRNDFMDILIELKNDKANNKEFSLTLELLVGQAYTFFVAGFETTSCTMAYALYELAKHQDIQQKAREEIRKVLAKNENQLNYESLKDLKYLKQIIQETLRLYPIIPNVPRICRRSCTVQTSNGSLHIPKDTTLIIPIYGIQHNAIYYPEPEKFCPGRFAEDEMDKNPYSFLAFGAGPKNCLGELFAKTQMILGLATLLSRFSFSLCEKTPSELSFDPNYMFILYVKGGVPLTVNILDN